MQAFELAHQTTAKLADGINQVVSTARRERSGAVAFPAGPSLLKARDDEYFRLSDTFTAGFAGRKPVFGYGGLGEYVFYRTYARLKDDDTKESFYDVVCRVVEGTYEIQRRWCRSMHIPWDLLKAQDSAQEMFQYIWDFKFLPPGRGLWCMGTPFMWQRGSACLNNCAFVSTEDIVVDPAEPFCFLMDMSMLGVGVGFDTKGANQVMINKPTSGRRTLCRIADSREGWVGAVRLKIDSYTIDPDIGQIDYDASEIRPAKTPIRGFGGLASGPEILLQLLTDLDVVFSRCVNRTLSSVEITDIMNIIGACIVAGQVRRTAEIGFGEPDDEAYMTMKDYRLYPEECRRWRWASNNSVFGRVGMKYDKIVNQMAVNGEPGIIWLENMRDYGRLIDGKQPGIDANVRGTNPCLTGETTLDLGDGNHRNLRDLWIAGGCKPYDPTLKTFEEKAAFYGTIAINNGYEQSVATNVYRTAVDAKVVRVSFIDGRHLDATPNHPFIVLDCADQEWRMPAGRLKPGDRIPYSNTELARFATSKDERGSSRAATIKSVEQLVGLVEIFCLTEQKRNTIAVNGLIVGNCGEQSLESYELCCLVETFPTNHRDDKEYLRTLKFAYLYGKTVTILPTHNPRTNSVMLRNRRIGLSQSGVPQALHKFGRHTMMVGFCDAGYHEITKWDRLYSRWLCIPMSNKRTCLKPSGTVSLVAGAWPGIHYQEATSYWRTVRDSKDSPLVKAFIEAGYRVEPAQTDPDRTVVIYFGVNDDPTLRTIGQVSVWEQFCNVVDYQTYWTDNQPSCTIKFKQEDKDQVRLCLETFDNRLKAISVLPFEDHGYAQAPYQPTSREEVDAYNARLKPVDFVKVINGDAQMIKGCDGDQCTTNN